MRGRILWQGAGFLLATLGVCGYGSAAAQPYLVSSLRTSEVVHDGAQLRYPAAVDEQAALKAVAEGGLWVLTPDGGRVYLQYVRHEVFPNGDWTWVGRVPAARSEQSAVITFGKNAVYGVIPRYGDTPLHLTTRGGKVWMTARDPAWARQGRSNSGADWREDAKLVPSGLKRFGKTPTLSAQAAPATPGSGAMLATASATASANTTVDVLIAYTGGMVTALGSDAAVITRVNYLISYANQAYINSNVSLRVRLVKTVKVSYTDDNSNDTALQDISGFDETGNSVPIPPGLAQIASLRDQYGADLVSLMRPYRNATQGGCGVGWLIGGGQAPITAGDMYAGYSVIGDGSNNGYFCEDKTLTHELGHNMGLAHDRANASKDSSGNPIPGAFAYSFGYKNTPAGTSGFGTIMAYEDATQDSVQKFSGPDLLCDGYPCGIANNADNAQTLRQTVATIATFEPTKVPSTASARADVNGDDMSDLLFYNPTLHQFSYRIMNGASVVRAALIGGVGPGYYVAAVGDFNGDGKADIVWTSAANDLYMWIGNGTGFTSVKFGTYPAGWKVVGAADVDGDGKADLLFHNASTRQFSYRIMNGTTQVRAALINGVGAGYTVAAVGDFNGDGKADIVWTSAANDLYMWTGNGTTFTSQKFGTYPAGWKVVGAADVDGDGRSDLLFYNANTRQVSYRIMNGTTQVRAALLGPAGSDYWIAAIGDYNGDGKADIVWTSAANDLYMWTGDGTAFTSQKFGSYPAGWSVVSVQ